MYRIIKVYEAFIDDTFKGIMGISFVNKPAMESNLVMLSESDSFDTFIEFSSQVENNDFIVCGAVAIPYKEIPRVDPQTREVYAIYMTEQTIKDSQISAMKNKGFFYNTQEHRGRNISKGVVLLESWLITDPINDESTKYGYNYPKGTWMVKYKVIDPFVQREIELGKIKGYSLEGRYNFRLSHNTPLEFSKQETLTLMLEKQIDYFLKKNNIKLDYITYNKINKLVNEFIKEYKENKEN